MESIPILGIAKSHNVVSMDVFTVYGTGIVFLIPSPKPEPMKTNFKFYFYLILGSSFLSALGYGLAQSLVEKYITIVSFGLLAITVISIAGMMRCVASMSVVEAGSMKEIKTAVV